MCGITGFYGFEDKDLLKRMTSRLEHRGPDNFGYYSDSKCSLGHRRLSIIDLSEKGKNPMHNEDHSIWITYNGEIYNFKEIRDDLEKKGHRFYSDTDTEVIIHSYEEYGFDCLSKFNGMFAFCIYDSNNNLLFLARDRLGIKPLYYYVKGNRFIFASEIKAILEDKDLKRELNREAMKKFFAYEYVPHPMTIFKNIHKLPSASYLILKDNKITKKEYWDIKYKIDPKPEDYFIKEIRKRLEESVKMRLISDVPLGAFLSGGIDSSSVVALMSKINKDMNNHPVKTFSIGFDEENKTYSEAHKARKVSEYCGTDHNEKVISSNEILKLINDLPNHMDEPFADPSLFPTYLVSEFTRSKVTVSLSGDGGDELFAGYDWYAAENYYRLYKYIPFKRLNYHIINQIPQTKKIRGFINKLKRFTDGAREDPKIRHLRWQNNFGYDEEDNLILNEKIIDPYEEPKKLMEKVNQPLNKMMYVDMKYYLVDDILKKVDMTSMKVALEARVPFLDYTLVEFAAKIPENMKLRGIDRKYILKKAMLKYLPKEILYGEKQGFTIPLKNWLRKDLKYLIDEHLNKKRVNGIGIFNIKHINKLINEHLSQKRDNQHQLWALINFDMWYKYFIEEGK